MRKITILCCLMLFTVTLGRKAFAQDTANAPVARAPESAKPATPPVHYYHLDFVIEELGSDSKPVNSRTYSTTVSTGPHGGMSIRTGSRIPIATGSMTANGTTEATQYQYVDVGVNIDVNEVHEVGSQLAISLTADLTGLAQSDDPRLHQPVIRQNKWQAPVLIPIGKASVAFTSDSLDNKGGTRVVVTATPLL
ncbi:MAG TPA: hypothetical protein VGT08_05685 [Terracidiphilus sp.]|nr:hypothetical protein [Terracidiphilus sp.]